MNDPLASLRARCDASLERWLPSANEADCLADAMRYAVLGGGKRLRPLLVYAAGSAFGVDAARLEAAAAAVEMIHAYSLVHDDLPAMDDDDLRRGRPTVHRAFDEATAILAGDALQALAFETIARGIEVGLTAEIVVAQTRELAIGSGALGMAGGQALDLAQVGRQATLDTLSRMHRLKTGALILASTRLGALAGRADAAGLEAIDRYGRDLGLAFQIQDDILDEIGNTAITGKTVGADRDRGKPTFTSLLGLDEAQERARQLHMSAVDALSGLHGDTSALRQLADRLVNRDH